MATNYLETGDTGRAISVESDGALYAGIFGSAKYVLENGSQFKAEVQSNNIVKISDGDAVMYGRHVRIPANDSALVTINNGHSGTNRIDLIVFRYTKDSTGKETVDLAVIQGEDSTGTAAAPATIDGDILAGAMQADFPLYRVELNGINIVSVTAMFDVIGNISQITQTNKDLTEQLSNIKYKRFSVTKNFTKGVNNAITISGVQWSKIVSVQGVLRYSNNLHVLPASPAGASGAYNEGMLAHLVITSGNIVQLWDGCKKAAVFLRYDKEYPVPIVNGKCAVPDEITGYKRWKVYLVGEKAGYRITTNEVEVRQS